MTTTIPPPGGLSSLWQPKRWLAGVKSHFGLQRLDTPPQGGIRGGMPFALRKALGGRLDPPTGGRPPESAAGECSGGDTKGVWTVDPCRRVAGQPGWNGTVWELNDTATVTGYKTIRLKTPGGGNLAHPPTPSAAAADCGGPEEALGGKGVGSGQSSPPPSIGFAHWPALFGIRNSAPGMNRFHLFAILRLFCNVSAMQNCGIPVRFFLCGEMFGTLSAPSPNGCADQWRQRCDSPIRFSGEIK